MSNGDCHKVPTPTDTCNPLLNHLVVECLIKHVRPKNRKSLRLVCSTWNCVVANLYLVKDFVLVLDDQYKITEYVKMRKGSALPIPQFSNCQIKIQSCLSECAGDAIIQKFWKFHQEFIRVLRLEVTSLYAVKLNNLLLYNLNSLSELKVTITKFWGYVDSELNESTEQHQSEKQSVQISPNHNLTKFNYVNLTSLQNFGETEAESIPDTEFQFPMKFVQFFERYPNLMVLRFVGLSSKSTDDFVNCLMALQTLGVKLKLKELEILDENMCPSEPNNAHIRSLTETVSSHFKHLEQLHLELSYDLQLNVLIGFLQKLTKCLKVLKLRRFPLANLAPLHLDKNQVFPSLTVLEVSDELFGSLDFLPSFPNLTTLHIILRDYRQLIPTQILQNTTTEDLHPHLFLRNLFIEQPLENPDCVTRICQLFPNLTHLKARMDNEMLQEMCRFGSQLCLEHLHIISWDGLTDQGFTGIPDNFLKNVGLQDYCLEEHRKSPYISCFKSMKELTVEIWPDQSNHVSDASVYFGFLDLPNLRVFNAIRTRITPCAARRFPASTKWNLED